MKRYFALNTILLLAACGGGDSGGSSTPPTTPTPVKAPTMHELEVPDGFDYSPVVKGALSVDISNYSTKRAHLTIYTNFKSDGSDRYIADYNSVIASASLNQGATKLRYSTSDSQGPLLVEIWLLDQTQPLQKVITKEETNWAL
ncbi:hypothetical protein [Vibrio rotiferianus]|uniref:hypothetical protein n=1 Tax=Vibrio rotiferianus TaxID=190895 RepID=UPI000237729D|nr:hypothetical protein [Vibrio rotiferianus]